MPDDRHAADGRNRRHPSWHVSLQDVVVAEPRIHARRRRGVELCAGAGLLADPARSRSRTHRRDRPQRRRRVQLVDRGDRRADQGCRARGRDHRLGEPRRRRLRRRPLRLHVHGQHLPLGLSPGRRPGRTASAAVEQHRPRRDLPVGRRDPDLREGPPDLRAVRRRRQAGTAHDGRPAQRHSRAADRRVPLAEQAPEERHRGDRKGGGQILRAGTAEGVRPVAEGPAEYRDPRVVRPGRPSLRKCRADAAAWQQMRDGWRTALLEKSFRAWPAAPCALDATKVLSADREGLHLEAWRFYQSRGDPAAAVPGPSQLDWTSRSRSC